MKKNQLKMKKITNLEILKPGDIVKFIENNNPAKYCIIEASIKFNPRKVIAVCPCLFKDLLKKYENNLQRLEMVEFDKKSTILTKVTSITEVEGNFPLLLEILSPGSSFTLYTSSIEEVQKSLKEDEDKEVGKALQKVLQEANEIVANIKSTYTGIISTSMEKILLK